VQQNDVKNAVPRQTIIS